MVTRQVTKLKIYKVFSTVNYLSSARLESYFVDNEYHLKLEDFCLHDEIYNNLISSLMNRSIEILPISEFTLEDMIYLRNLVSSSENAKVDNDDANLF